MFTDQPLGYLPGPIGGWSTGGESTPRPHTGKDGGIKVSGEDNVGLQLATRNKFLQNARMFSFIGRFRRRISILSHLISPNLQDRFLTVIGCRVFLGPMPVLP